MNDLTDVIKKEDCIHRREDNRCRRFPKTEYCDDMCGEAEFQILAYDSGGNPCGFVPWKYADLDFGAGIDLRRRACKLPTAADYCDKLAEEAWRIATGEEQGRRP